MQHTIGTALGAMLGGIILAAIAHIFDSWNSKRRETKGREIK